MLADLPTGVKQDNSRRMDDNNDTSAVNQSTLAKPSEEAAAVSGTQSERRTSAKSGEEVILRELCARARSTHERLRTILTGRVLISLRDLGRSFLFDWNSSQATIEELPAASSKELINRLNANAANATSAQIPAADEGTSPSTKVELDCYISLNDRDVYRIYRGDLNPQIAMLSDKIEVGGKLSFAVYFFNLIAPRMN